MEKIEKVILNFATIETLDQNDVMDWLLGWLKFFPDGLQDKIQEMLMDIMDKYYISSSASNKEK